MVVNSEPSDSSGPQSPVSGAASSPSTPGDSSLAAEVTVAGWIEAASTARSVAGVADAEVVGALELDADSILAAVAANHGVIVIDDGWLQVLAGGVSDHRSEYRVPSLRQANPDLSEVGYLQVAFDVLGGIFAIDAGGIGPGQGQVCYFAPDTLAWEDLELGYSQFLEAMLAGGSGDFYADARWNGWQRDVTSLTPSQGFAAYPFPFTAEGADPESVSRRPVPLKELHELYRGFALET